MFEDRKRCTIYSYYECELTLPLLHGIQQSDIGHNIYNYYSIKPPIHAQTNTRLTFCTLHSFNNQLSNVHTRVWSRFTTMATNRKLAIELITTLVCMQGDDIKYCHFHRFPYRALHLVTDGHFTRHIETRLIESGVLTVGH